MLYLSKSVANISLPENINQNFQAIIDNHNEALSEANSTLQKKFSELIGIQSQIQNNQTSQQQLLQHLL